MVSGNLLVLSLSVIVVLYEYVLYTAGCMTILLSLLAIPRDFSIHSELGQVFSPSLIRTCRRTTSQPMRLIDIATTSSRGTLRQSNWQRPHP